MFGTALNSNRFLVNTLPALSLKDGDDADFLLIFSKLGISQENTLTESSFARLDFATQAELLGSLSVDPDTKPYIEAYFKNLNAGTNEKSVGVVANDANSRVEYFSRLRGNEKEKNDLPKLIYDVLLKAYNKDGKAGLTYDEAAAARPLRVLDMKFFGLDKTDELKYVTADTAEKNRNAADMRSAINAQLAWQRSVFDKADAADGKRDKKVTGKKGVISLLDSFTERFGGDVENHVMTEAGLKAWVAETDVGAWVVDGKKAMDFFAYGNLFLKRNATLQWGSKSYEEIFPVKYENMTFTEEDMKNYKEGATNSEGIKALPID